MGLGKRGYLESIYTEGHLRFINDGGCDKLLDPISVFSFHFEVLIVSILLLHRMLQLEIVFHVHYVISCLQTHVKHRREIAFLCVLKMRIHRLV